MEKFDCIYYVPNYGEEIPYCRRSGRSESINRHQNECDNQGEKILFRHLLKEEISPNVIFKWSSSVEMTDLYANIFHNRSLINEDNDGFICKCTKSGTFGKYCEYRLTHKAETFGEAIKSQFEEKEYGDSWNTQRYGKILCYETLPCSSSPLCLDWREICDGEQRCSNGTDEENWDKLEMNECEDDEFRCRNGMCIAEKFWLDGDYDCMDWSDEYYSGLTEWCSFKANAMECDEHLCFPNMYSCGDGECVSWPTRLAFQRSIEAQMDCFNKRNLNYMCEISRNRSSWTLKDGLCWPDRGYDDDRYPPWENIHSRNLTNEEKCQYLFRCVLSKGFEKDCPCNYFNCIELMKTVCSRSDGWIFYPLEGLINPNIFIVYNYTHSMENPKFQSFRFGGELKCRGFFFQSNELLPYLDETGAITWSLINHVLCTVFHPMGENRNYSSVYQENRFCWNDSLTFNGRRYAVDPNICPSSGECISQYRIRDGTRDCYDIDDEMTGFHKNYCTGSVQRHRFQCFNNESKCLPLIQLGTSHADCSNSYDESWYGMGNELRLQFSCEKNITTDCHRLREYIQQSSIRNSSYNDLIFNLQDQKTMDLIPFQHYCNSFWSLEKRRDEMSTSCQYWICEKDQYQCQTGQCIPFQWVCDGEWDCSDASDEQAIFLIHQWSNHNAQLPNLFDYIAKCREQYSKSPFSNICNISFEFGCYRSNVSNPLDIDNFRPCIHLTQIGDNVEDCYNAYDEKNTFTSNWDPLDMWGFYFRCKNNNFPYPYACDRSNNCTEILCSYSRNNSESCSDKNDFICLNNSCVKTGRCNNVIECPNGEDEYWCPSGTLNNRYKYRFDKNQMLRQMEKPFLQISYPLNITQHQISNFSNNQSFKIYSYQCNRGIAVIEKNQTQCLCPPAYYGQWCQFFSDRISIIAHLDQKNNSNITLKIQANLLFNDRIIDSHQFNIIPLLEIKHIIKHKFYLLYSRSDQMLTHKRQRYFNRNDVINNHPYSVHFNAFSFDTNNTIEEIGSWHYPIYFDYLPAFRLAVVLKFPSWFKNTTLNPCRENNCNENSTCLPIFNQNNTYYCSCKSGYYGKTCNMYESFCENSCSNNGLCRIDYSDIDIQKKKKSYCICPMDYFGKRCHLKLNDCYSNPCLNNGTCFPLYDRTDEYLYLCTCSERFYGFKCEKEKSSVNIHLNITTTISARATVIQLYTYINVSLTLLLEYQELYHNIPSSIKYSHSRNRIPELGIMKIYEDFSQAEYFLIYFLYKTTINITSFPIYCPHASFLLPKENNQSDEIIFKYHLICQNNNTEFHCFYDEKYFCICQDDHYRVECFIHDTQLDRCSKCLSGGKCLQGNLKDSNNFLCSCPSCHQGQQCQFNMQAFSFTLHSLYINYSKQMKIIYLTIVCLLFIIGLFNNICSFFTFKRSIPRKFSVGNYLFIVSCFNQISLLILLFKFFEITFEIIDLRLCQLISYFLSVMTRSTYWLTSWISVDRLLMILFPTSSFIKNARLSIGISIFTLIILFVMHIHEIIYYTIIEDISTGSFICVTNFDKKFISTYNRISILIHYLVPFLIQIISITFLIILAARSRVKTIGQKLTFIQVLKKQFAGQKELYVTPVIIILSALPQTILTFSFACTQLNEWQRHTLLVSYLLSYTPQLLGFILQGVPKVTRQNKIQYLHRSFIK